MPAGDASWRLWTSLIGAHAGGLAHFPSCWRGGRRRALDRPGRRGYSSYPPSRDHERGEGVQSINKRGRYVCKGSLYSDSRKPEGHSRVQKTAKLDPRAGDEEAVRDVRGAHMGIFTERKKKQGGAAFRALTTTKMAAAAPVCAFSPYSPTRLFYCPSLTSSFFFAPFMFNKGSGCGRRARL